MHTIAARIAGATLCQEHCLLDSATDSVERAVYALQAHAVIRISLSPALCPCALQCAGHLPVMAAACVQRRCMCRKDKIEQAGSTARVHDNPRRPHTQITEALHACMHACALPRKGDGACDRYTWPESIPLPGWCMQCTPPGGK